ncbi:Aste57867_20729 [Aphanomyces stellatus]|uniref:Aste57867_20729 protein n=1 Tax=Aphanomyces stellatus TaxID=120398 RepID=A0A485LGD1_9STRA|nr:hypothetical protein As57867_020661 [Aphanomyces stellatus]VFT97409.1 Aste57867_20729 [Aphanomyces stellatus]
MHISFILAFAAIVSAAESASHWAEYLALPNITSIICYDNSLNQPRTLDVLYNGDSKIKKSFDFPKEGLSLEGVTLPEGLESFVLPNVHLKSIPTQFKWPSTLKALYVFDVFIVDNGYSNLDSNQLDVFPTHLPRSIESLSLRKNLISQLPQSIEFPRLRILDVGTNKLSTIPDDFSLPQGIEYLFLSNNQITTLPANSSWIGQIRWCLYLNKNQIQDLPSDANFPESTNVANNRITTLANLALPHSFDIGHNPLETVYRVTMSSKDSYWLTSASTLTTFVLEESVFEKVRAELGPYYPLAWKSDNDSIAAVCEFEQGTVRALKNFGSQVPINVCVVSPY